MALAGPGPPPFNDPPLDAAGGFNQSWWRWLQSLANQLSRAGYVLPVASTSVLGGVMVDGVSVTIASGVITAHDTTYTWTQATPAATWTVTHHLGRYPSVEVADSAGSLIEGDVVYTDANTITLTFAGAFSGVAYLN